MSTATPATAWRETAVRYIDRTHAYYDAQGFTQRYRYAAHDDAPFTALTRPLSACTVGLVTTSALDHREPLEPRKVDSGSTETPPHWLFTDDLSWDKNATHTDDRESFLPIGALKALAAESRIGALAPRFHCAPTEYSQRATQAQDAPEILERLRADGADVAILFPL